MDADRMNEDEDIIERAELRAENARLRAAIERVRKLADDMEREAPKPQAGGFLADGIRQALVGVDEVEELRRKHDAKKLVGDDTGSQSDDSNQQRSK